MVEIRFSFSRSKDITVNVSDKLFYLILQVLETFNTEIETYPLDASMREIEAVHIDRVLKVSRSPKEAAKVLGISHKTLWDRRRRHPNARDPDSPYYVKPRVKHLTNGSNGSQS